MRENQIEIVKIFERAICRPSGVKRQQFVDQACGQNTNVKKQVIRLLNAHDSAGQFLESPAAAAVTIESLDEDLANTKIGPYKLLEVIGEGGMGTVYMAQQTEPVQRRVALKLIKTGMDTRQVIARFEAERQALAIMDHPNIAKVLDAGATESGRPYFVMELVKGTPITEFCDEQRLDLDSRLKLFQHVCHAVQHAHQKGIIHRDIKPSNVLVAMYDDKPVPKVIDFGVAKVTGEKLTEKTMFTRFGQIVGTLQYMSPEQAQFNQLDIDTRSDIYSLGAVLYELLSGQPPFAREQLNNQALDETLRMIREEEPTTPSTNLNAAPQPAKVASNRKMSPEKLASNLRGDLDWIVMKALQKDRTRRYESASGLANDISRHLNNEPVLAGPPSLVYRLRKFARKHQVGVAAAFVSMLLLLTGSAGLLASNSIIRAEKNKAQARSQELKQVAEFQADLLSKVDPYVAGEQLTQNVIAKLNAALCRADLTETERANQVAEFSKLWRQVNASDTARDLINVAILKPALVAIDEKFPDQPLVAAHLRTGISYSYYGFGLYDDALALDRQILATRRTALGEDELDTIEALHSLGTTLGKLGKSKEAEAYLRSAVTTSSRALGDNHQKSLLFKKSLGAFLSEQGQHVEAEFFVRQALDGLVLELGTHHEDTLDAMLSLGHILSSQNKLSQAEPYLQQAAEGFRQNLGNDHPRTLFATDVLGLLLTLQGRLTEAEPIRRENYEATRRVLGENHPNTLQSMNNLAVVLMRLGRHEEAELYFRESLDGARRVWGEESTQTLNFINNLACLYFAQEKWGKSEACFREAVDKKLPVLGPEHPDTITSMGSLGYVLCEQGKLNEAEPILRQALASGRSIWDESHPNLMAIVINLSTLLEAQGKFSESIALLQEIRESAKQAFISGNALRYARLLLISGQDQLGLGEFTSAEKDLLEANSLYDQHPEGSPGRAIQCTQTIVELYATWHNVESGEGYSDKAIAWKKQLDRLLSTSANDDFGEEETQ